jgi:hypothetical protein
MTAGSTMVGIVEWGARAHGACRAEGLLSEALATRIGDVEAVPAKIDWVRAARRHAWHAELWAEQIPVLHDVVLGDAADLVGVVELVGASPARAGAIDDWYDGAVGALLACYRRWGTEAGWVAEGPFLRTLELVVSDSRGV